MKRFRSRRLTPAELESAWQHYQLGRTPSAVARTLRTTPRSLKLQLRAAGYPLRPYRRRASTVVEQLVRPIAMATGLDKGEVLASALLLLADQGTTSAQILARYQRALDEEDVPKAAPNGDNYDGPLRAWHDPQRVEHIGAIRTRRALRSANAAQQGRKEPRQ